MQFTIKRLFVLTLFSGIILSFARIHFNLEGFLSGLKLFFVSFAIPFRVWAWLLGTDYWAGYVSEPPFVAFAGFFSGLIAVFASIVMAISLILMLVTSLWDWSSKPKIISPSEMTLKEFHKKFISNNEYNE